MYRIDYGLNFKVLIWTDCFRRAQTQSLRDFIGWPSGRWRACLPKDPLESWRCSRKECVDKLLGMIELKSSIYVHFCLFMLKYICIFVIPSQLFLWDVQGMDFTTDKLRSLVKKWQTLIEAHVDVKTTDNYTLRMFCIGFTRRRPNQIKRTCYAQSSQIRQVLTVLNFMR